MRLSSLLAFCFLLLQLTTIAQPGWKMATIPVQSRWAKEVSPSNALAEYPRPQLVRANWQNLNGLWQYAITAKDAATPSSFEGNILVPFAIESALSGVKKMVQPDQNLWYKKMITKPALKKGEKLLLHFGAVDWQATVFVNQKKVGFHSGGYQNFTIDITSAINKNENELLVKVYDPTDQGPNPHGKQVLNPKDIWYTPVTGIWQTVWLEKVSDSHIDHLKLVPDLDKNLLQVQVNINGATDFNNYTIEALASDQGKEVARKSFSLVSATAASSPLTINNAHPWSPNDPYLYDLEVKLLYKGKPVDVVKSYFGMRKVEIKKDADGHDRIFLNNQYIFNLGTLDQGFWPDGIYTAPTDEALAFDVKAIKAMGFNTIRKHIKREPDRWYYHCDKLGMIVWQDMINPSFTLNDEAKKVFEQESKENIEQLYNHPCITTWVLFNEKWGQYDQQRLSEWIKKQDPTRLLNGHSGEILYVNEKLRSPSPNAWVSSDITDIHSYPDPMNAPKMEGKARVLGEFGGIGLFIPDHQWNVNSAWGYVNVTPSAYKGKYTIMNQHVKLLEKEGLTASIYTQPFDVEGEQNGLMTYDREVVKIPFEDLQKIHGLLVPVTGKMPEVQAQNAEIADPGLKYSELLGEYIQGNRQPEFLKKISMAAQQVGDKPGIARITNDYLASLKKPYSAEDLTYVVQVTSKVSDPGFAILKENSAAINNALGQRQAETKMMNIIYTDAIAPAVTGQNPNPNWASLSAKVAPYGSVGEEILLRARALHFFNQHDWNNFVSAADEYISKYGQFIKTEELNKFAWTVFEGVGDKDLLSKAAAWSKLSIDKKEDPQYIDTYANLLYKAGRSDEAIKQEEKAVTLSGGNEELKQTLEKMKRGEATWK
jgi:hypothetical protein